MIHLQKNLMKNYIFLFFKFRFLYKTLSNYKGTPDQIRPKLFSYAFRVISECFNRNLKAGKTYFSYHNIFYMMW